MKEGIGARQIKVAKLSVIFEGRTMTPADLAKHSAISFECKKDRSFQKQNGDWRISIIVQAVDMDQRLTMALPGTRYMAVLVEIGADEMPVQESEVMPNSGNLPKHNAQPQSDQPQPAGAKRRQPWETLLPQQQAAMRSGEAAFTVFLKESYPDEWHETTDANECLKLICGVASKRDLELNHAARVLWHQLDSHFVAWGRVSA